MVLFWNINHNHRNTMKTKRLKPRQVIELWDIYHNDIYEEKYVRYVWVCLGTLVPSPQMWHIIAQKVNATGSIQNICSNRYRLLNV